MLGSFSFSSTWIGKYRQHFLTVQWQQTIRWHSHRYKTLALSLYLTCWWLVLCFITISLYLTILHDWSFAVCITQIRFFCVITCIMFYTDLFISDMADHLYYVCKDHVISDMDDHLYYVYNNRFLAWFDVVWSLGKNSNIWTYIWLVFILSDHL